MCADIPGKRNIQCDEMWSFVYAKEKRADEVRSVGCRRDRMDVDGNGCGQQAAGVVPTDSRHRDTESATALLVDLMSRLNGDSAHYHG